MNDWLALVIGLPTANATARMRAWRALKACGAAVLRDGVYLLPNSATCHESLVAIERDILCIKGTAYLLPINDPQGERFLALFDRVEEYAALRVDIEECREQLTAANALTSTRQIRKLRKAFAQLSAIDFFPGDARQQTDSALQELEAAVSKALSADEPGSHDLPIKVLSRGDFQGRLWATRKRPWVDRLASAWLIQRFIDRDARILWLDAPGDCPADALGFDFDGAAFSHIGHRVTFETLQASFELEMLGLDRIAALVHYLDVGGAAPAEAAGIERVLAGLRETIADDDQLLAAAGAIFDGLLAAFVKDENSNE
ncbi:chromate resistance protein ChrB domain-containing protein [Pseudomonas boanensis]|uniref:chromate resistance protein ChrB domain-containing protein n=1 Tax=Metapseudomonas boanensis TaxID=2822138 RepID=UPI0035D431DF